MSSNAARDAVIRTHLVRGRTSSSTPGLSWFRTGAPHEELNGVLSVAPGNVRQAQGFFQGVPVLWYSWPDLDGRELERVYESTGLAFVEEEPVMLASLTPWLKSPEPRDVDLHRVTSTDGLVEWAQLWTGTAQPSFEIIDALAFVAIAPGARVRHLLARREGIVVGCAAVVIIGEVASIEHVVTIAPLRGRGIGTALTQGALDLARRAGATTAVLTASPDGLRLYERLGFEAVGTVRRFA